MSTFHIQVAEYMFPHSKQQVHIACTQFLYSLYDMVLSLGMAVALESGVLPAVINSHQLIL